MTNVAFYVPFFPLGWIYLCQPKLNDPSSKWHPSPLARDSRELIACALLELCAEATYDGMVIKNIIAWYFPCVHVRLWIWKYFVCWCACNFDHMLKVLVWIDVNVQFPVRGWHTRMRGCKRECLCATGWGRGQGLMRRELRVFACGKRGNECVGESDAKWGVDEVGRKCVSASVCVYMCEPLC